MLLVKCYIPRIAYLRLSFRFKSRPQAMAKMRIINPSTSHIRKSLQPSPLRLRNVGRIAYSPHLCFGSLVYARA
jgi:hypothetical protein